ncbi:MAG: TonB-dependent receptor [Bacteroidota bacterium]
MKTITSTLVALFLGVTLFSQTASIKGVLQTAEGEPVLFSNVVLYNAADSSMLKVEVSDESGVFRMDGLSAGNYFITATYVGYADFRKDNVQLTDNQQLDLGIVAFAPAAIELEEAIVTASRAMVEVKPDRTVFNVQGTINSTGADAISLLRKAPGVTVDNNNNINVLGRAGALLYVDGKRLPITGEDLTNYLENLPAEQIDRIEIITNPGAKYEAEGNAGIIDIRLKKDKNLGGNGSVSLTSSQGVYNRSNLSATGNYRNRFMNGFVSVGGGLGQGFNKLTFESFQNGLLMDEVMDNTNTYDFANFRVGTDFFLGDKHTLGFLVGGGTNNFDTDNLDIIDISQASAPDQVDSVLVADSRSSGNRDRMTYNINYRFDNRDGRTVNIDLDYGNYQNLQDNFQPNQFFDATRTNVLTEVINSFESPSDIGIYSAKLDYEQKLFGGVFGAGAKLTRVVSDNTFLVFDVIDEIAIQDDSLSNEFEYIENVYAGYISYNRPINEKWNFSAGLRAEQTDALGTLTAFVEELNEDPVVLNYLSWFPSAGLTWQVAPKHMLALNYGRRINRPDYNVLNPFNQQASLLSFEKGNPFLRPEIVNNFELGYTLAWRYNFKLSYSLTEDQITRLIAPSETDDRAGFITWENLASQTVVGLNISAPIQFTKWWSGYFNLGASYLDNQADYGDGAVVDVQAFTYNIYQQQTFNLPKGFKGEISGWFAGPGVWGGVFRYESQWSLDLGIQRRFFNDAMNVRVAVNDIFYQSGWDGVSEFNGLVSSGSGRWDSRRASLSISYNFGNQNVKSRKRKTGIEAEAGRVGGDN